MFFPRTRASGIHHLYIIELYPYSSLDLPITLALVVELNSFSSATLGVNLRDSHNLLKHQHPENHRGGLRFYSKVVPQPHSMSSFDVTLNSKSFVTLPKKTQHHAFIYNNNNFRKHALRKTVKANDQYDTFYAKRQAYHFYDTCTPMRGCI